MPQLLCTVWNRNPNYLGPYILGWWQVWFIVHGILCNYRVLLVSFSLNWGRAYKLFTLMRYDMNWNQTNNGKSKTNIWQYTNFRAYIAAYRGFWSDVKPKTVLNQLQSTYLSPMSKYFSSSFLYCCVYGWILRHIQKDCSWMQANQNTKMEGAIISAIQGETKQIKHI